MVVGWSNLVFASGYIVEENSPDQNSEVQVKFQMGNNENITRLLAIVAMDVEEQAILKVLGQYEELTISENLGIKVKIFSHNGKELWLAKCGIGLVNAGIITAIILDQVQIDGVILFGVAGALTSNLMIGDLVIATNVIQHDSVFSGDDGEELMAPGKPYVSVPQKDRKNPFYKTDAGFRNWIKQESQTISEFKYVEGAVLSGSEFVGSAERKLQLARKVTGAIAVEMESAAIAQVTNEFGVPFAVLKTIADRLNANKSISNDYNQFIGRASANAAQVMGLIWRSWTLNE